MNGSRCVPPAESPIAIKSVPAARKRFEGSRPRGSPSAHSRSGQHDGATCSGRVDRRLDAESAEARKLENTAARTPLLTTVNRRLGLCR